MILGIGVDLCRVDRIRRSVTHFGKAWLDEVFTEEEQARLGVGDEQAHRAAVGFALKEACAKAIGTGFTRGVRHQDFVVLTDIGDNCSVLLTGRGKVIADHLRPDAASPHLHTQCVASETWANALAVITVEDGSADALPDLLAIVRCIT